LDQGFAPLPVPINAMFVVCLGKSAKRAVVVDDKIEIREIMNTVWTIDHRFGDAAIGVSFIKIVKAYTEDPENFNIEAFPDNTVYKSRSLPSQQKAE